MDLNARASEIAELLRSRYGLPSHVLYRLSALVADEPLLYVDSSLDPSGSNGTWSGEVVVFTPTRLIRAALTEAPQYADGDEAATVSVTAHQRRVPTTSIEGADAVWQEDWEGWPAAGRVEVTYEGAPTVVLPLNSTDRQRERLNEFLVALMTTSIT
jgi:hypothetical protein